MIIWRSIKAVALPFVLGFMVLAGPLSVAAQDSLSDLEVQNASAVQETSATPEASPAVSPEAMEELTGYIVGDPDAPVTLQIYADYQCPHCRNFFNTIEPQLIDEYVRTGQVKLELLDFTVVGVGSIENLPDDSLESVQAAEAAMCAAEQDAYLDYYRALFSGDVEPNSGDLSDDNLKGFAEDLGLDTAGFNTCLDSGKYEDAIIAYVLQGVDRGVPGTPSLSINGGEIFSVGDFDELKEILDAELGE